MSFQLSAPLNTAAIAISRISSSKCSRFRSTRGSRNSAKCFRGFSISPSHLAKRLPHIAIYMRRPWLRRKQTQLNRHAAGGATGRVCGDDPGFGRTEATLAGAAGCLRNGSNAEGIDGRAAGLVNGEQIAAFETGLVAA